VTPTGPTARQQATRSRLIEAAAALAREGDRAFTMRDIARRAGVSPATAYTYFGSREHVLAEAYAEWVEALATGLADRPPAGATPRERIDAVIGRAVAGVAASPELARAFTLALAADDPAVATIRPRVAAAFASWMQTAFVDGGPADVEAVATTLELVMFAAMLSFAHGLRTVDQLEADLRTAAGLVMSTSP
jgi:AcrR family transcriptional regulator